MPQIKITASDAATSETAERSNAVKKTTKKDDRKAKKKIAFLESIITDIREKYNNTEIPPNSDDSHAIARARGEIDSMINWRTYAITEGAGPMLKKKKRKSQRVIVRPEDGKKIIEMRKDRKSYSEIVETVGYSKHIVSNYCVEHGMGGRKRKRKIDPEIAARMYDDGYSYKNIAERFGCTADAVCKALQIWRLAHE